MPPNSREEIFQYLFEKNICLYVCLTFESADTRDLNLMTLFSTFLSNRSTVFIRSGSVFGFADSNYSTKKHFEF